MAFESLFSKPPNPVDKNDVLNMTESELAGNEREDGELEDGEIDDDGFEGNEVEKEPKESEKEDKSSHRRSKKKRKREKEREKKKTKKRKKEKHKRHSPSSGDSDFSYDSDFDNERSYKKGPVPYREYDAPFPPHAQGPGNYMKSPAQKSYNSNADNRDYADYSDYSEEKYDTYEEEECDDFANELKQYKQAKEASNVMASKGPSMEQMRKPGMKGIMQKARGRGIGRGRAIRGQPKQKRKTWGPGRGSDGGVMDDCDEDGYGSFARKKRKNQDFSYPSTGEKNRKGGICKYFLEGRCTRGDQCRYSHDVAIQKKKDICKFYLNGFCTKGDNCIFMHGEYPCKFYHTGAKCYQGDNCKFSHAPLTEETRELLDKVLNNENVNYDDNKDHSNTNDFDHYDYDYVYHEDDDKLEIEELRKQGISPLPKPPPGVGLLPTPPQPPNFPGQLPMGPPNNQPQPPSSPGRKIPSIFDIVVQPTDVFAHKMGLRPQFYNSSSPTHASFDEDQPPPSQMYGSGPGPDQNMMPPGPNGPPDSPGGFGPSCPAAPHNMPGSIVPPNVSGQQVLQDQAEASVPPGHPGLPPPPGFPGPPINQRPNGAPGQMGFQGPMMNMPMEHQVAPPSQSQAHPQFPSDGSQQMQQEVSYQQDMTYQQDVAYQQDIPYQQIQNPGDFYSSYYSQPSMHNVEQENHMGDGVSNSVPEQRDHQSFLGTDDSKESDTESDASSSTGRKPTVNVPDFLPAKQKALFLRIKQKQQEEGGSDNKQSQLLQNRDEDETVNWYSSDEEEDGSSVKSILKTLKKQSEIMKNQQLPTAEQSSYIYMDPRLGKDKTSENKQTDLRSRPDLRQGKAEVKKPSEVSADPRLARDPRKMKVHENTSIGLSVSESPKQESHPVSNKQQGLDDDEDTERELREKAAIIPLETIPGVTLRDPRCQLKQFSHIKMDITLSKPNFAKLVIWTPEDLLPLPLPKPDPVSSINLPLPPLIANQRLNRAMSNTSDSRQIADPRLSARSKENSAIKGTEKNVDVRASSERPLDPRLQKSSDPRLQKNNTDTATRESHSPRVDPRLSKASSSLPQVSVKIDQTTLPPYAPKLSAGGIGIGSPSTLLSGISLYDPRTQTSQSLVTSVLTTQADSSKEGEQVKKLNVLKDPMKPEVAQSDSSSLHKSSVVQESTGTEDITDLGPEKSDIYRPQSKMGAVQASTASAPAVHNLPIQALAGLIRPQYSDPRQTKHSGPSNQAEEDDLNSKKGKKPLKEMFKTFDPTASPFC